MKQVIIKSVNDVGVYFGKQPKHGTTAEDTLKALIETGREQIQQELGKPYTEEAITRIKDNARRRAANGEKPSQDVLDENGDIDMNEQEETQVQPEENTPAPEVNKPPAQVVSVTEFIKVPFEPGLLISGDPDDANLNRVNQPTNTVLPLSAVKFEQGAGKWRNPKK